MVLCPHFSSCHWSNKHFLWVLIGVTPLQLQVHTHLKLDKTSPTPIASTELYRRQPYLHLHPRAFLREAKSKKKTQPSDIEAPSLHPGWNLMLNLLVALSLHRARARPRFLSFNWSLMRIGLPSWVGIDSSWSMPFLHPVVLLCTAESYVRTLKDLSCIV